MKIVIYNISRRKKCQLCGYDTRTNTFCIKTDEGDFLDVSPQDVLFLSFLKRSKKNPIEFINIIDKDILTYGLDIYFIDDKDIFSLYLRKQGESFFRERISETAEEYNKFLDFCRESLAKNKLFQIKKA